MPFNIMTDFLPDAIQILLLGAVTVVLVLKIINFIKL